MRKTGFTLIELLVVIAIIAILAAILFPVFARAREAARKTQCVNNSKQLNTAVMQYINDYDERFPMKWYDATVMNTPCVYTVYHAVAPYKKNVQIMECPSEPKALDLFWLGDNQPDPDPICPTTGTNVDIRYTGYAGNWCLMEVGNSRLLNTQLSGAVSQAQLNYAVQTAVFYDGTISASNGTSGNGYDVRQRYDSYIQGRHNDIAVASFADGHARVVKTAILKQTNGDPAKYGLHAPFNGNQWKTLDGKTPFVYYVIEAGPYRWADYGFTMIKRNLIGIAEQRSTDGQWCWYCPMSPGGSGWNEGKGSCSR